ncbi:cysteine-rich protein 2-binding protein, partial [Elysia marginata]
KRVGPKKKALSDPPVLHPEGRRSCKNKASVLSAAMELKEKRVTAVTKPKGKTGKNKRRKTEPKTEMAGASHCLSDAEENTRLSSSSSTMETSLSSSMVSQNQDEVPDSSSNVHLDFLNAIKLEAEDEDDDLDIDIGTITNMPDFRPESPDLSSVLGCVSDYAVAPTKSSAVPGKSPVAQNQAGTTVLEQPSKTPEQGESAKSFDTGQDVCGSEKGELESESSGQEEGSEDDSSDDDACIKSQGEEGSEVNERPQTALSEALKRRKRRYKKRRRMSDEPPPSPPPRLKRISVFEERELLQKLNATAEYQTLRPDLAQLRRKLICNQTNREFGLPVFDLDNQLEKISRPAVDENFHHSQDTSFISKLSVKATNVKETRDLDRFMVCLAILLNFFKEGIYFSSFSAFVRHKKNV